MVYAYRPNGLVKTRPTLGIDPDIRILPEDAPCVGIGAKCPPPAEGAIGAQPYLQADSMVLR